MSAHLGVPLYSQVMECLPSTNSKLPPPPPHTHTHTVPFTLHEEVKVLVGVEVVISVVFEDAMLHDELSEVDSEFTWVHDYLTLGCYMNSKTVM